MRDNEIKTREVSSEFVDDLVHDDQAHAYEASSAPTARRTLHTSVAPAQRPNVRRRDAREEERSGGFFSDGRNILLAIVLVLGIALTVLIISSVRSCINSRLSPGNPVEVSDGSDDNTTSTGLSSGNITTVPVVSDGDDTNADASDQNSDATADNSNAAADDAAANTDATTDDNSEGTSDTDATTSPDATTSENSQASQTQQNTNSKPTFEVSVAAGELSWLEISVDGTTLVAETVTGPWSASYTPESNFSISVGNHLATSVTQDGEPVAYNYSASGVGNISVDV